MNLLPDNDAITGVQMVDEKTLFGEQKNKKITQLYIGGYPACVLDENENGQVLMCPSIYYHFGIKGPIEYFKELEGEEGEEEGEG